MHGESLIRNVSLLFARLHQNRLAAAINLAFSEQAQFQIYLDIVSLPIAEAIIKKSERTA